MANSTFDTNFAASALPMLWDTFAATGRFTYSPQGENAQEYDAIIGQEMAETSQENTAQTIGYSRKVTLQSADLAAPKTNASAEVDAVSYVIRSIKSGAGVWVLDLFRSTLSEVSGAGYRRRS